MINVPELESKRVVRQSDAHRRTRFGKCTAVPKTVPVEFGAAML